jgi:hypothetical protein
MWIPRLTLTVLCGAQFSRLGTLVYMTYFECEGYVKAVVELCILPEHNAWQW